MTRKLYYEDSHIYEFSATVTATEERQNRKAILLNTTAFFPGGGGQAADSGCIENYAVFAVEESNGNIYHIVDGNAEISAGDTVHCKLDSGLRFARMQAHSGEHILSGVAHNLYSAENVGFHMDDLVMTVDFSIPLSKEQLGIIENEANNWVYRNVPVRAEIYSGEKLLSLQYRSKLSLTDNVRIVTIEGCDSCACCAPHVNFTGEIGLIKILTAVSHRGGVRLTVICGFKAYSDYIRKHNDIMKISDMLKVPNFRVVEGVNDLCQRLNEEKHKNTALKKKFNLYIADSLDFNSEKCMFFVDDCNTAELRELADLCKNKNNGLVAVFSGDDDKGYSFAVSAVEYDLSLFKADLINGLKAKCGGNREILQGNTSSKRTEIEEFFKGLAVQLL